MRVNKAKFRLEIFEKRFKGNYNQCAKALGVETPQLHRFLKLKNSQAWALLLGGLYSFCEKTGCLFGIIFFYPNLKLQFVIRK